MKNEVNEIKVIRKPNGLMKIVFSFIKISLVLIIWVFSDFIDNEIPSFSTYVDVLFIIVISLIFIILLTSMHFIFQKKKYLSFDEEGIIVKGKTYEKHKWSNISEILLEARYDTNFEIVLVMYGDKKIGYYFYDYWIYSLFNVKKSLSYNYSRLTSMTRNIEIFHNKINKIERDKIVEKFNF